MKSFVALCGAALVSLAAASDLVDVELFVMSQCPDAQSCTKLFDDVIAEVGGVMDLKMEYITKNEPGKPNICMHGSGECEGNMQQLCAQELYPSDYAWWDFVRCEFDKYLFVPMIGSKCAADSEMDFAQIDECVDTRGDDLLTTSGDYTRVEGIEKSCSIRIEGELVCVNDSRSYYCPGGYTAENFIQQVCDNYDGPSPPAACQ